MSESTFSYQGYELKITFESDAVQSECPSIYYCWRLKDVGEAVNKFKEFIDIELPRRKALDKILSYQQEVWEKQDILEKYVTSLDYCFYTYTMPNSPNSQGNCRYAVHPDYVEAFQRNKNSDFPKWAVIRII